MRNPSYQHLQDPLRPFGNMTVGQIAVWAVFVGSAIVFGLYIAPWLGIPGSWTLGISVTWAALPWAVSKGVSGAEGASVRVIGDLFGWLAAEKRLLPGGGELIEGYVVEPPETEERPAATMDAARDRDEIEDVWK